MEGFAKGKGVTIYIVEEGRGRVAARSEGGRGRRGGGEEEEAKRREAKYAQCERGEIGEEVRGTSREADEIGRDRGREWARERREMQSRRGGEWDRVKTGFRTTGTTSDKR